MSEAVKARRLYDWLILHCDYEDAENDIEDQNNHLYSSVFLQPVEKVRRKLGFFAFMWYNIGEGS